MDISNRQRRTPICVTRPNHDHHQARGENSQLETRPGSPLPHRGTITERAPGAPGPHLAEASWSMLVVSMKVRPSQIPLGDVQQDTAPPVLSSATAERAVLTHGATSEIQDGRSRFRVIYDDWFEDVSRWARALGGLEADQDDIVQEVFLVVRRRLDSFDGDNPAGWLYRITRRQVRDFRRRTWVKHIFNRHRSDDPDALPFMGTGPAAALEHKEKQRVLFGLLQKMGEARRSAFVLFEIEGLSGEEIARIQSVPVNTVWTRLHHARREFFALAAKYQKAHAHESGKE
jgi:RNA polymerase sigma-70 factor (ECF subfamily)